MRYIKKNKGDGPRQWLIFARQRNARYDTNPEEKKYLRQQLAKEQFHLCAFCMKRLSYETDRAGNITSHDTKIAHLISRSIASPARNTVSPSPSVLERATTLSVSYKNVVLACKGLTGIHKHCDNYQDNDDVTIPLFNQGAMSQVRYLGSGFIAIDNPDIQKQIGLLNDGDDKSSILNLNNPALKAIRKGIIDQVIDDIDRWTVIQLERKIQDWKEVSHGRLQAYCDVALYFLEKHKRKLNANSIAR